MTVSCDYLQPALVPLFSENYKAEFQATSIKMTETRVATVNGEGAQKWKVAWKNDEGRCSSPLRLSPALNSHALLYDQPCMSLP